MNKWYGVVGYIETKEDPSRPGIWIDKPVERHYYGEFTKKITRFNLSADKVNEDVDVSNELSIVSDPYSYENFHNIRYVEYMGNKWRVNSVEPKFPRLVLALGGLYNND